MGVVPATHYQRANRADVGVQEYFDIKEVPTAIVYKGGKQLRKVEGMNMAEMKEVATMMAG